jgi:hypothetical protein
VVGKIVKCVICQQRRFNRFDSTEEAALLVLFLYQGTSVQLL